MVEAIRAPKQPTRKGNAFRIFHKMPFKIHSNKAPKLEDKEKEKESMPPHQENAELLLKYDPLRDLGDCPSSSRKDSGSEASADFNGNRKRSPNEFEQASWITKHSVYLAWLVLLIFAHIREFMRRVGLESNKKVPLELDSQWCRFLGTDQDGHFPPLYSDFESTYTRNCYMRVKDVFERPIGSCPGAKVNVLDRYSKDYNWSFIYPGTQTEVINTGSYNYLGFAQSSGPCAEAAAASIDVEGITTCGQASQTGLPSSQHRLESLVADFLGTEDAICFPMGFATNSLHCTAIADKNTLILSDEYNHASLRLGSRLSGANVKAFKHNGEHEGPREVFEGGGRVREQEEMQTLQQGITKLIQSLLQIIIIIEGIYSMEGSICDLPTIIALKKKYKAYLYLDEAHSIGAMGRSGRGVVEYWDVDVRDVDIMMGTFTKSFGSAGGYIAGSKRLVSHLRRASPTNFYCAPMSPPVAEQIIGSMSIIMGKDGTNEGALRIDRLARNARYFRLRLKQMGFIVYGSDDSPVVPLLIYYPTHCGEYGRQMLARKIAVVVVSFPATDMTESRVRFCLSAAHTKEMLDEVLDAVNVVGDHAFSKHSKKAHLYKNKRIEW
ncbi:sptl-2 [Pristionchus pacificus]|uniref:serine C-palmitoyltransferase n=1 Tax=Pristionchus pacificus TaxID=54126 RepID=A0A2A6C5L1_PRIPA|nr:sptl-2 [Pristionchus pacificus]|eukprot:PDM73502.1 sptl-2 [Pristionchus pacificus]